mmetsp:Transcript_25795/g.40480  ORF Transcript_25795/g.40480 Transcript_25795/m.40480 type:complete len:282 (-) Transcript_25795:65-910(-)
MSSSRITSLLRRRGRIDDVLPMNMNGGYKRSNTLGRRRYYSSPLVKCMLAFGALALMIFHRNKGKIAPRLRVMTRTYLHPDWHSWSREKFFIEFHCDHHLSIGTKAVPTLDYWQTLRDVYNSEVDNSFVFDDPVPPTQGYTLNENGAPPYYAGLSPGRGRSLFAIRDIKEGEVVDGIEGGTKSDLIFPNKLTLQRYLLALPEPMACDAIEWSYTETIVKGGPRVLVVASDIASLMNTADTADGVNVKPENESFSTVLYASRDIKKGEEILMNYGVFPADIW